MSRDPIEPDPRSPSMSVGDAQLTHFGQRAIVAANQATAYAILASLETDEERKQARIKQALECIDVSNRHLKFAYECVEPGV